MLNEALLALPTSVVAAGSGEDPSLAVYLGFGVLITLVLGVVGLLVQWYVASDSQRWVNVQARLLTHSSIFWSRWPYERLWSAPYTDLAAEADRCGQIIGNLLNRRGPPNRRGHGREREEYDYFDRQIATHQGMLDAVHSAMNYAISQGRGPQQPYRA